VSKLAKELVEIRTEHLTVVAEVASCAARCAQQAAQQGLAAFGEAAENRFQELANKIHVVQVATAEEILGLTQDLASMRSNLGGVTEAVAKAAAASIQRTEARLATELDSKCDEIAKFVGAQQEELRLKASSLMSTAPAERVSQEREGPEPSGVSVGATGAETRAHPETAGDVFGADSKAVISLLRHCLAQVDAVRTQVCDLQLSVKLLECNGSTSDSKNPAQIALCKACRSAPATQGTELGRNRLNWTESHPSAEPLSEREKLGEVVMSAQQSVPADSEAERQLCHSGPALVSAVASIRPLHRASVASTRPQRLSSSSLSLSRTLRQGSCLQQGSCPSPPPSARSVIVAQHSPRNCSSEASLPGRLQVRWPPSAATDASGFVERHSGTSNGDFWPHAHCLSH